MKPNFLHGDFTELAKSYSSFRPGYSNTVVNAILSLLQNNIQDVNFADVGAGTGIWTRIIDEKGTKQSIAIEPNDEMRKEGIADSKETKIIWAKGSGENTGLPDSSIDLITMASSFHWVDFHLGITEFARVLKRGGIFAAVWNPRVIEVSPLLSEIEQKILAINPRINRISSGKSNFVEELSRKLLDTQYFEDLIYIEGRHSQLFTQDQYIGVWQSVNDVRFQLGEKGWLDFIEYLKKRTANLDYIEQVYMTRAWVVRKK